MTDIHLTSCILRYAVLIFALLLRPGAHGSDSDSWLPHPPDRLHFVTTPPSLDKNITKWQLSIDGKYALSIDDNIVLWDVPLCRPLAIYPGKTGEARFSPFGPNLIYISHEGDWWILADIYSGKTRGFFRTAELPKANEESPPGNFLTRVFNLSKSYIFSDMDIDAHGKRIAMAGPFPIIWNINKGEGAGIRGSNANGWRNALFDKQLRLIDPQSNFNDGFLPPFWTIRCAFADNDSLFISLPAADVHVFDNQGDYSHRLPCRGVVTQLYAFGNHIIAERNDMPPAISVSGSQPFSTILSRKGRQLPFHSISNISSNGYFIGKPLGSEKFTVGQLRADGTARWRSVELWHNGGSRPKRFYMSQQGKMCSFTNHFNTEIHTYKIICEEDGLPKYELPDAFHNDLRRGHSFFSGAFISDSVWVGGTTDGSAYIFRRNYDPVSDVCNETDILNNLHRHAGTVIGIKALNDNQFVTADSYGSARIWDSASFSPVATMTYFPKSHDYIIYTPDNYYKATTGATNMIHYVKGLDSYSFRQFDLKYNRPDIVLQRLGGDPREIEILHSAWLKRLRKLGFDPSQIDSAETHAPELSIVNKNALSGSSVQGSLSMSVVASDSISTLRSLHVFINGVPIFGSNGISLNGKSSCSHQLNLSLGHGQNIITVYCLNTDGQESLRQQISVTNSAPTSPKRLFVAAVGVSDYLDASRNLNFAASDAEAFVRAITNGNDNFAVSKTLILKDNEFSTQSLSRIREFFARSAPDDVAILYYAGHGILDSNLNYFLGSSTTDFANPERAAVKYEDFQDVLESIPSLHRYCIVDACHSGDIDKDEVLAVNTLSDEEFGDLTFRSAGRRVSSTVNCEVAKQYHSMFVDLAQKEGITIVASSSGDELSVESAAFGGGLFTHVLNQALSGQGDQDGDGRVSVKETFDYVVSKVPELSGQRQNPQVKYHEHDKEVMLK